MQFIPLPKPSGVALINSLTTHRLSMIQERPRIICINIGRIQSHLTCVSPADAARTGPGCDNLQMAGGDWYTYRLYIKRNVTVSWFTCASIDISIAKVGALGVVVASPPANALTTAAMIIVTTSISITPTTGDTASSPRFNRKLSENSNFSPLHTMVIGFPGSRSFLLIS